MFMKKTVGLTEWLTKYIYVIEMAQSNVQQLTALYTIRYDTIVEINVHSKAEYTA